jgi:hypothetical protein
MKRQHQVLLIASTLALSWLAMQAVHELGHVAAAIVSGGRVAMVVLHPATISYTQLMSNPHPLLVSWMGPVVGVVLPFVAFVVARMLRLRGWYLFQFFAGFCFIANGAYLAFGSLNRIGDAGDILRLASPVWLLWLFGVVTIPIGLMLWDRLGSHFGLGASAGQVDRATAYGVFALLVLVAVLEITLSPTRLEYSFPS